MIAAREGSFAAVRFDEDLVYLATRALVDSSRPLELRVDEEVSASSLFEYRKSFRVGSSRRYARQSGYQSSLPMPPTTSGFTSLARTDRYAERPPDRSSLAGRSAAGDEVPCVCRPVRDGQHA